MIAEPIASSISTGAHNLEVVPNFVQDADAAVTININQDFGALILYSSKERAGLEVVLRPQGNSGHDTHVWVRPRTSPSGITVYVAVFSSLPEGYYLILNPDGSPGEEVFVSANTVIDAAWSDGTT